VTSITIRSRILGSTGSSIDAADVGADLTPDNKRARSDRRRCHPLLTDWRWSYRGRRKSVRRNVDNHRTHAILDWYHPSLFFFIVVTYVLSGIDAILTLTLLELGVAEEANPFMHMLLAKNIHLFAGVKALVTGLGLVCLAAYSNQCLFTRLRVDRLIYLLFGIYTLLVIYQVSLLRVAEAARWLGHG
jgi:hypothetical protein